MPVNSQRRVLQFYSHTHHTVKGMRLFPAECLCQAYAAYYKFPEILFSSFFCKSAMLNFIFSISDFPFDLKVHEDLTVVDRMLQHIQIRLKNISIPLTSICQSAFA